MRIFYCQQINLKFDSIEFNNIASPIISFFGFIGIIVTIILGFDQFRHLQSSNYFDYYRSAINNFLTEENDDNLSTIHLLDFTLYCDDKYDELKKFPEYFTDLNDFKKGIKVSSKGKKYDEILGNVRYFRTKLHILLKRYSLMIDEISQHKQLNKTHKELLLKEFFENQITEYTTQLLLADRIELKDVKENFYIAFSNVIKEDLAFYDSDLYELKNKIEENDDLKIYLNENK
ncbi:hypothetical protein CSW08_07500 [Confluentibacter flavum]|uniref:Uncharacterized protein n=1 Tax=Confluentibacter flavum TaxID=1909700 RepID=A0A2N3HKN3_9FLAO|nr:hypothetical protein CSW08_07500 [Confluentibacter flavum]